MALISNSNIQIVAGMRCKQDYSSRLFPLLMLQVRSYQSDLQGFHSDMRLSGEQAATSILSACQKIWTTEGSTKGC